ncbi:hypothetical protein D6D17_01303 [Aureobasidium pullulans]|uniref:Uncharacterized protein n=1 Tax=Aureobasidium pullulans TaxID=5580 RepID=A0A4T0AT41_AURPU|nr:hypothetical protein D6D28_03543 [Aureobasidium pullulans]THV91001.1 hypothetical protein D6D27_05526 [Aureobasidium pullulans]THW46759.1 hypothetical protein D6D21_03764 [Aureobasidium pullulans]THW46849.1 hypothetical protein D6D22_02919 [Aureobasidium pullulans]THW89443.1 hypothetical protein D6D15_05286 [Aureobasidium pullulans]
MSIHISPSKPTKTIDTDILEHYTMLSTASASEAPPSGFERKLSTSIQRLRANSVYHERTFGSGELSKYDLRALAERSSHSYISRSQQYIHRLKAINRRGGHNLTNDEARFFLSLPDKIRRLHFTRQENILMRAACELQLSKDSGIPPPLPRSWTDERASSSHSYASSFLSRRTMVEPPSTPTTSDGGYPSATSSRTSSRPRTQSVVSSNASILPFNPLACHPPRTSSMTQSPFDYTKVISKTPETPAPVTRQYLDPKTREMIRRCTSSPEAFDEVINFGYATDEAAPVTKQHPSFDYEFDEDLSSSDGLSDDDEDEDYTLDSDDEPWTPGSDDTMATSWDFRSPCPPIQRFDGGYFRTPKERPMTLRVTLTKPENRSAMDDSPTRLTKTDQEDLSSLRVEDPLALERLTFSDDVTGMYGAFAVSPTKDSSKMKKLLKRLTSPAF